MNTQQIQEFRDNPIKKRQQGDVLIREVDCSTAGMKKVEGNVVASSSNPHTISGGILYRDEESQALFAVVDKKAKMMHREHKPVALPAGTHFIEPKVEIDFLSDMVRPVQD